MDRLLDGVMRRVVIERAAAAGSRSSKARCRSTRSHSADEAFLTNSVRGILPVSRLLHAELPAPGPVTRRVWDEIFPWLVSGGTTP